MKYIPIPNEFLKQMRQLTDEEYGRLIRWCQNYNITGKRDEKDLTGNERFYADIIIDTIDRFSESYDRRCESNRRNGSKGGRPVIKEARGNPSVILETQDNPSVSVETQKTQQKQKLKPNLTETINSPYSPSQEGPPGGRGVNRIEERFNRFWAEYPKKTGKQAALKSWKKLKPSEELTQTIIEAVKKQKEWPQWQEEHGRFIPNPATWLNQGRWDDERTDNLGENGDTGTDEESSADRARSKWGDLPL